MAAFREDIHSRSVARCVTQEYVMSEFGHTKPKQGSSIFTVMKLAEIFHFLSEMQAADLDVYYIKNTTTK